MKHSISDLEHIEMFSKRTGEKFSLSAVLSDAVKFKDVFIHHDIIPPGRRSSAAHAHSNREEMIVVLSGAPTVFLGGESTVLKAGDFVGIHPGMEYEHYVANQTTEDVCVLVIASNPKADQIFYSEL